MEVILPTILGGVSVLFTGLYKSNLRYIFKRKKILKNLKKVFDEGDLEKIKLHYKELEDLLQFYKVDKRKGRNKYRKDELKEKKELLLKKYNIEPKQINELNKKLDKIEELNPKEKELLNIALENFEDIFKIVEHKKNSVKGEINKIIKNLQSIDIDKMINIEASKELKKKNIRDKIEEQNRLINMEKTKKDFKNKKLIMKL